MPTQSHGVQIYDTAPRRAPTFVGHLLPLVAGRPVSASMAGDTVVIGGCAPRLNGANEPADLPQLAVNTSWDGGTRRRDNIRHSHRSARPSVPADQVTSHMPAPFSEKPTQKIASEDSWYVTTGRHVREVPGRVRAETASGGWGDGLAGRKRMRDRSLAQLKAAVTPKSKRPIQVARVSNPTHPHSYSTLELMVNRRASVERYW